MASDATAAGNMARCAVNNKTDATKSRGKLRGYESWIAIQIAVEIKHASATCALINMSSRVLFWNKRRHRYMKLCARRANELFVLASRTARRKLSGAN